MILDDGGDLTALMHKEYKDLLKNVKEFQKKQLLAFSLLKKWKQIINYDSSN